jgi:hypothetical protein
MRVSGCEHKMVSTVGITSSRLSGPFTTIDACCSSPSLSMGDIVTAITGKVSVEA